MSGSGARICRSPRKLKVTQDICNKARETVLGNDITLQIIDFVEKCTEEYNEF